MFFNKDLLSVALKSDPKISTNIEFSIKRILMGLRILNFEKYYIYCVS